MNDLNHISDFETQISTIVSAIKELRDIGSYHSTLQHLKNKWIKCVILKKHRWWRKRTNFDDAYILWVLIQDGPWVGIKIHPDKYENCKRIYNDTELMSQLVDDWDVPNVYNTFVHNNVRVVLYEWSRKPTVEYAIKRFPHRKGELEKAIQARVDSLVSKWFIPDALGHSDMIAHSDGSVRITDFNKIAGQDTKTNWDTSNTTDSSRDITILWRLFRRFW